MSAGSCCQLFVDAWQQTLCYSQSCLLIFPRYLPLAPSVILPQTVHFWLTPLVWPEVAMQAAELPSCAALLACVPSGTWKLALREHVYGSGARIRLASADICLYLFPDNALWVEVCSPAEVLMSSWQCPQFWRIVDLILGPANSVHAVTVS